MLAFLSLCVTKNKKNNIKNVSHHAARVISVAQLCVQMNIHNPHHQKQITCTQGMKILSSLNLFSLLSSLVDKPCLLLWNNSANRIQWHRARTGRSFCEAYTCSRHAVNPRGLSQGLCPNADIYSIIYVQCLLTVTVYM